MRGIANNEVGDDYILDQRNDLDGQLDPVADTDEGLVVLDGIAREDDVAFVVENKESPRPGRAF